MTCPLCAGPSAHRFSTTDRNRELSEDLFHYRRCHQCGVIFLANVPDDLSRYYPDAYYVLPSQDTLERGRRAEAHKLALVQQSHGRLTEIGPGAGGFSYAARRAGFDVTAIEMDPRACEHLRTVVGVETIQSDTPHEALDALSPSHAITLWHVLEHLRDPWQTLESAARNLGPGGTLTIAVPNPDAVQLRALGGRWAHVDAPRHLFLLPSAELIRRAEAAGLDHVRITARDRSGLYWNRFGWQQVVGRPNASRRRIRAAVGFGVFAFLLMSPLELPDLGGAAYTAVFRKP